jgi:outer membrane protein assembly factor BamA
MKGSISTRQSTSPARRQLLQVMRKALLPAAALLLMQETAGAQTEISAIRDTAVVGKLELTGYPYIFYSPETEFALGGAMIITMRLSPDKKVKASNAILSGYYSVKGSYDLFFNPEFFLDDERYYLGISADYFRFVDKFWGIGNNTSDIDSSSYIRRLIWLNVEFDVSVVGPLKIGLNYDFNSTAIVDKQSNPFLLSGDVTGSDGGLSSGLGGVLFADTRNSAFYPTAGGYYKLSLLTSLDWLGSDFSFSRWILDLRHYVSLAPPLVLALQVYGMAISDGDPPFYMLPALGGDNAMRGYYEGRYRDKFYLTTQAELRARLTRRWGLVGWVGIGDVAGEISGFRMKNGKPTFGLGIRFALDPEEVVNVRADFGYGRDTQGIYFNAKEAF